MVKSNTKTTIVVFCVAVAMLFPTNNSLFAQDPPAPGHWRTGAGNPPVGAGVDNVTAANNFFGTSATNPLGVRMGTRGFTRMFIADGGTGATDGFIAIGNGFLSPRSRVHLHQPATIANGEAIYMQITNGTTGNASSADGFRLGINGGGTVELRQQENFNMLFFTGSPTVERMRIIGTNTTNKGFVGINKTTPKAQLHVVRFASSIFSLIGDIAGWFEIDTDFGTSATGIIGAASGSNQFNFGGFLAATGAGVNYGLYAFAPVGGMNRAGFFDGVLESNQPPIFPSDEKLKTNIQNISNANDIISRLRPVTFQFRTSEFPMQLPDGLRYGLLAQEIDSVLPEILYNSLFPAQYDTAGNKISDAVEYKSIDYIALIPLLLANQQQQQKQIDSLKNVVAQNNSAPPMNQGNNNNGTNNQSVNQHFVELEGLDKPFLSQNRPNPFSGQTEIDYYVPNESATDAHILFYDQLGRMLKDEPLKAGFGTVTVNTRDLPAGVYTYKLLINGQVLDTKKMVYTK